MIASPTPVVSEPALPPRLQAIHARLRLAMPHLSAHPHRTASFSECGGDSLDLVELLCAIESDYGLRLTIDDVEAFRTLGDLLELIDRRALRRPSAVRLVGAQSVSP